MRPFDKPLWANRPKNSFNSVAGIGLTMTVVGRPMRRIDIDLNKRKEKICEKFVSDLFPFRNLLYNLLSLAAS